MITKENILFCIVGLLGGLIIGFTFANSINQRQVAGQIPGTGTVNSVGNLPGGHPPMGGSDGSVEDIAVAIEKARAEPDNFEAQIKAAELYYQIQRFEGAIEFLQKAAKIKPDDYVTMVNLGNAYFDSGKFEEAEKAYNSALEKKPDDADVRADLGLTFVMRPNPDLERAIKEFGKVLEKNPSHTMALQNLATAYTKKGDTKRANETIAKLESADPTNASLGKLKEEASKIGPK